MRLKNISSYRVQGCYSTLDGLTEVFQGEEEFGDVRLLQSLVDCKAHTSEGILQSLWTTLDEFSDGSEQSDDMTAMVLVREG